MEIIRTIDALGRPGLSVAGLGEAGPTPDAVACNAGSALFWPSGPGCKPVDLNEPLFDHHDNTRLRRKK